MTEIWMRSDTFAHGFFVFPISAWLIWRKRDEVARLTPSPSYCPLILILFIGFVWLLARSVGLNVVEQLALVSILICSVWAVLGGTVMKTLAFPLGFLFLAVPMGEFLVPTLMEITADITVGLLQLTGISVYREGLSWQIPSGHWSVVWDCSGIRYLMASITLGCLYAYISYRRFYKRIVFMAFSVILPIIGNGLRAYGIVMIFHLGYPQIGHATDHYIYGWLFFGVLMLIMFSVGSIWKDREEDIDAQKEDSNKRTINETATTTFSKKPLGVTLVGVLLAAAVWPIMGSALSRSEVTTTHEKLEAKMHWRGWEIATTTKWSWTPPIIGQDDELSEDYLKDGRIVQMYVGFYQRERQGNEMVSTQNLMVTREDSVWSKIGETRKDISGVIGLASVRETELASAKIFQALAMIFSNRQDGAIIAVATEYVHRGKSDAAETLSTFISEMHLAIEESIDASIIHDKSST